MIARSLSSITPDFDASATIRCSSSAVTRSSDSRLRPSRRNTSAELLSSSQTSGAAIFDSQTIGAAMKIAMGSGARSELLGHQLARDQRDIGGERDDGGETRGFRILGIETQPGREPVGHRLSQARARIGAGQDADRKSVV